MPDEETQIQWTGNWEHFDRPEDESALLEQLRSEIESNPGHALYGKDARILGFREYDDFILYLTAENRYAYVHLTWRKETDPRWPSCVLLEDVEAVNAFLRE